MFNIFKKKDIVSPTLVKTDNINDKIEHILSVIKDTSVRYIGEKEKNFRGLTDIEIENLENINGQQFPTAYRLFLKRFAGGQLKIYDHQLYNIQGISEAQEVSKELVLEDGATLPDKYFAFSQWQGYQFYYFINSGNDNPDTFLYIEGGGCPNSPPEIYAQGCFTDWLVNLSIENMILEGKLNKYNVTKE